MINNKHVLNLKDAKPNLSEGVNVIKIEKTQKKNYDIKPRIPIRKKTENIRDFNKDRVNFTEDIDNIWKNKTSLENFEKPKKSKGKLISFLIFLIIFAGIFFTIVYLNSTKTVEGEGVVMTIESEDSFVSGSQAKIKIKYSNNQNIRIKDVELRINYPQGFYYIKADPSASTLSLNVWKLKDLRPNQSGEIVLYAQIIGEKDQKFPIEATLYYEPSNFNSILEVKSTKEISISDTLMDLSLDAPDQVQSNNKVEYKIKYKNISESTLDNFRIRLDYGENFIPINTSGDAKFVSDKIWVIENLKSDEEKDIIISGFFNADLSSSSSIKAILEIKSLAQEILIDGKDNYSWLTYKEVGKQINLLANKINIKTLINEKFTDEAYSFGDELSYQILYKNLGKETIENVKISTKIDSQYIDFDSVYNNYNAVVDKENKTITWDENSIPALSSIKPGQEARLGFKIKILGFKNDFLDKNNYTISSISSLYYGENATNQVQSNIISSKINTPVDFSSDCRYYDESGAQLGSGPLPPIVGELTGYRVFWKFNSKLNGLKDITIKTTLPVNVDFENVGVQNGQNITFDEASRQLTFQVASTDKNKDNQTAFNLMVTPTKGDKGKFAPLTSIVYFSGTDVFSGFPVIIKKNPLTTECFSDKKASPKGKVID